ncbi:MAG: hypothetical protein JXB49_33830 [Bacteroidales bacterium]|nr:hypothetical protein [Bacteroidales bacterium]
MNRKFDKARFLFCFLLLFLNTNFLFATEATISVSEEGGVITVNATATFTSYTECDVDDSTNCINIDSGTLRVFHNGTEIGNIDGNGSAQVSTTLESSVLPQGENAFSANAKDRMEIIGNATEELFIDNTPLITLAEPETVEGEFDIFGTAKFKNYGGGFEGTLYIWIDGELQGEKQYEGASINWSYSDITGQMLDSGSFGQGEHTIVVKATAENGALSENANGIFIIDNTPFVTLNIPGVVTGNFNITGTADFSENAGGVEGELHIWIDGVHKGMKEYEGTDINWSYSEITGQTLNSDDFAPGEHTISVKALSDNGAWSDDTVGSFTVENP